MIRNRILPYILLKVKNIKNSKKTLWFTNVDPLIPAAERESIANGVT